MAASLTVNARRRIGRTALEVPVFGLGGAHLGELYAKVPEADAVATLEAAWDAGVRLFDTAPWYGHGLSEHRVGHLLRQKPRGDFVFLTKIGRHYARPKDPASHSTAPWAGGLPFALTFDYSYDGVMRSYEQSLLRTGLNIVDALAIHDLDRGYHTDRDEFARHWRDLVTSGAKALEELKRSGDIKAFGAGINDARFIANFVKEVPLDYFLVAMPYTLLDQGAGAPGGGFDLCAQNGISVVIGSPYASGILADPDRNKAYGYAPAASEIVAKVERLRAIAKARGVPLQAAALQFVLAHPVVAAVIPGAVNAAQVRQNTEFLMTSISPALWDEFRGEGLVRTDVPVPA